MERLRFNDLIRRLVEECGGDRALLAFLWINERLEAALPCAYAQSNCDSAT